MAVCAGYVCCAISPQLILMMHSESRCILWVGDKHCGKTTAAAKLVRRIQEAGYSAGGILAPSVYEDGQLIGFDIIDIRNDCRQRLAVREKHINDISSYRHYQEGLDLGHKALSLAENQAADLVIVDEYGPLELRGEGWRADVDCLFGEGSRLILLVVRREIADEVRRLYERYVHLSLEALDKNSIERVLVLISEQCSKDKNLS